jgi:cell division protein ZapA (FtsZ GTPase activity inhibitor)
VGGGYLSNHVERVRVRIGKMTYQLTATDDPQKMRDIAATANAMMEQVAKRQPQLNQISQAVLALVNAVGMMQEAHEKRQDAYESRDLAERTAEEIRAELTRLREQFWQMKKELLYYRNLCEIYETKLSERMLSTDDEDTIRKARKKRRTRRTRIGDLQVTIEDAMKNNMDDTDVPGDQTRLESRGSDDDGV